MKLATKIAVVIFLLALNIATFWVCGWLCRKPEDTWAVAPAVGTVILLLIVSLVSVGCLFELEPPAPITEREKAELDAQIAKQRLAYKRSLKGSWPKGWDFWGK
jgi:hypothetical protein